MHTQEHTHHSLMANIFEQVWVQVWVWKSTYVSNTHTNYNYITDLFYNFGFIFLWKSSWLNAPMKYIALHRNNYYCLCLHTQRDTHMRTHSTTPSLRLPQWWQLFPLLPSKVRVAAYFPKLTPINTFQKIPQILRSGGFLRVPIQLVWIIIQSQREITHSTKAH